MESAIVFSYKVCFYGEEACGTFLHSKYNESL